MAISILSTVPSPLPNLVGEYLPLPEHRRFRELFGQEIKNYFTTDAIETLLHNLEMLIMTVGSANAGEIWVEVFKGKESYTPARAIGCVMSQIWFWLGYIPVQLDQTTIRWKGVPFFTWENIKQLAANTNPPILVTFADGRIALTQYGSSPNLTDEQAEDALLYQCSLFGMQTI